MSKIMTIDDLVSKILAQNLREFTSERIELKSNWDKNYGAKISAIANHESLLGGWVIVGVNDKGILQNNDEKWAIKTESSISNQIDQFLSPFHSVRNVVSKNLNGKYCIFIEVCNPKDVTEWDGRAYKLVGTSCIKMKADEKLALSMKLPGEDFTNQTWSGSIDSVLVLDFAKKVALADETEFPEELNKLSSDEILSRLNLINKMASRVLFGNCKVRVVTYDSNDDVIENVDKLGAYNILTDNFIAQIQSWTKNQGTIIKGQSTSVSNENPYPVHALREILANAVAHALYQREDGGIIVDIYPDHLTELGSGKTLNRKKQCALSCKCLCQTVVC